jgi:hypothetical protein
MPCHECTTHLRRRQCAWSNPAHLCRQKFKVKVYECTTAAASPYAGCTEKAEESITPATLSATTYLLSTSTTIDSSKYYGAKVVGVSTDNVDSVATTSTAIARKVPTWATPTSVTFPATLAEGTSLQVSVDYTVVSGLTL